MAGGHFHGEIRVAARIIDYLSSGLYQTPAACLKELINNSFDADAHHVHVFVKPDADRIIIEDDGEGITKTEFQTHFSQIAESHKRSISGSTKLGRQKIGKIGIGFIAANELCEKMEIFSTKRGSSELLHVMIDFQELRKSPADRKRKGGSYVKADYAGTILEAPKDAHYTHVFLQDIRRGANGSQKILSGLMDARAGRAENTIYGMTPESQLKLLKEPTPNTWKDFDSYSQTLLQVALNVPVRYLDGWLPARLRNKVSKFERRVENLKFDVTWDGTELRKPIAFAPDRRAFIREFNFRGKHVSAQGYFYVQHGQIKPIELQGLLVRIRQAAVGGYDQTFWEFSQSEYSLIQKWVSCEIWADDRLEDAMNIDRRTLRVTHPAYVELRSVIHEALRSACSQARSKIYEAGSVERKTEQVSATRKSIANAARAAGLRLSTRKKLTNAWSRKLGRKNPLLKKYSLAEFYQIVIEVAGEVLSSNDRSRFIEALTERIRRA